ncbi:MAG: hypothetical protein ACTSUQ_04545 [Candidatus Freyarchaeota archaeon]
MPTDRNSGTWNLKEETNTSEEKKLRDQKAIVKIFLKKQVPGEKLNNCDSYG